MNPSSASILLTLLLQSSLLVAGAWILISLQRKTSAARISTACRITMVAALALVAVTIGSTAFFLIPDSKPISSPATLPQGAGSIMESALLNSSESSSAEKPSTSPAGRSIANPPSAGPLKLPAAHARWLGAAWLTGAALVLTAWLRSLAARLTLLRRSENAAGLPWLEIAGEVKGWPLVHQVRLIPQEITPCVWGVRKTVLALPASAADWPTAKLKLVLAHECAHLLRRDPLWQILSRFFLALLWFHPLAWSIARRSQAADEQAADDTVLRTECDAPSYADLLVECARQFSLRPALQTTASAMASPSSLTRRVESVLDPTADRRTAGAGHLTGWTVILSLMTAAVCLAGPQIEAGPAASENPEAPSGPLSPAPVPDSQAPSPLFEPPIDPSTPRPPGPSKEAPPAGTPAEAGPPAQETTDTSPTESAPEATPAAPSFNWQPASRNGLDYLPVSQLKAFYKFPRLINEESGNFSLRSNTMIIKGTTGSNEMFINNVKFLLKHPALSSDGGPLISRHDLARFLDPVIRPSSSVQFKPVALVVIDPGHGGNDSGASGPQGNEAVYALDAAQRLQRKLDEMGIKALLTRNQDHFMSLKERDDFAASQPEAIFISLHFNSGPPEEQGFQTFFPDEDSAQADRPDKPVGSDYFAACIRLATAVHANCLYKLRRPDGGIRAAKYTTISGQVKTPAILIECGYLSHPEEAALIATEAYRQTLAEAVAGGVQNYLRAIQKGSRVPRRQ